MLPLWWRATCSAPSPGSPGQEIDHHRPVIGDARSRHRVEPLCRYEALSACFELLTTYNDRSERAEICKPSRHRALLRQHVLGHQKEVEKRPGEPGSETALPMLVRPRLRASGHHLGRDAPFAEAHSTFEEVALRFGAIEIEVAAGDRQRIRRESIAHLVERPQRMFAADERIAAGRQVNAEDMQRLAVRQGQGCLNDIPRAPAKFGIVIKVDVAIATSIPRSLVTEVESSWTRV
jgi:hypothetical protein